MAIQIQLRGDTAANWTAANPILIAREVGLEIDTGRFKVGNGVTAWAGLAYYAYGGLTAIVQDATPQLGGNLDLNGFTITGLVIGTDVQAQNARLSEIAALAVTDNNIIVGNGAGWVAESGATARTSLGAAATADLASHTGNTNNPHSVTAAQADALPEDAALLSKSGAYELATGDEGKIIECDGTFTVTCPNGLDTGFQVVIVNVGTGIITLAAATTLTSKASAVLLANRYGAATVYHAGSNVWRAIGDLS